METPQLPSTTGRFSRRNLFRLVGAGTLFGVSAETVRVLFGSNEHTVIPGKVYRSAQLSQRKLERVIAEKHIRTVINLRGFGPDQGWYLEEAKATHAAGISQEDITLSAKRFPPPSEIAKLIEVLDRTEYPVLVHCAQGADRTGLASVIVLLLYTNSDLATARRQLWPRYGHLPVGRTTVLDQFFDYYESWLAARGEQHTPERFRAWVMTAYCPGPFRASLEVIAPLPLVVPVGRGFVVTIRATNRAIEPWNFTTGGAGGIKFRYALRDGDRIIHRGQAGQVARTVQPGESIDFAAGFPPIAAPMEGLLWADMLDAQPLDLLETDFVQYGSEPLMQTLVVK
jgi:protein tyrosine/serine phosphatase